MRPSSMPSRLMAAASLMGLALYGSVALAQPEQPAAGETVTLAYKFKPNRLTRQKVQVKGDLNMAMGAQGGQPAQAIPMLFDMTMSFLQKVTAVTPTGEGTVTMTPDAINMAMNVMGQNVVIKGANGKVTATMNGQAMPNQGPAGAMGGMLGKPMTMRMSARGQVLEMKGVPAGGGIGDIPGLNMNQLTSGNNGSLFVLPDKPIAVGATWQDKITAPLPGVPGAAPGAAGPQIQMTTTSTLKSITVKNGQQIATIETKGQSGLLGPGGAAVPGKFTQNFTATTQFNVTEGDVVSSKGLMDMEMDMGSILGGAGAAPGGMPPMSIKGNLEISSSVVPATAPTPAKPAVKKPAAPVRRPAPKP